MFVLNFLVFNLIFKDFPVSNWGKKYFLLLEWGPIWLDNSGMAAQADPSLHGLHMNMPPTSILV